VKQRWLASEKRQIPTTQGFIEVFLCEYFFLKIKYFSFYGKDKEKNVRLTKNRAKMCLPSSGEELPLLLFECSLIRALPPFLNSTRILSTSSEPSAASSLCAAAVAAAFAA
jgi:hypothetical protein